MGDGSKNLEKSVEDVFKSGMDEMIRARAELEAAEAEQKHVPEVVEPTPSPELNPTGPPMPAIAPAADPLIAPPTPTGPPMPAIAPAADPLIAPPTPTGPPMPA
ncbi:MAG: choline-binding protein, partial [Thermoplasmata archaeon]|nr:choline-binding protein [Thermoplasmata archaeon]